MTARPQEPVSVLVPCRNGERYLGAALQSALTQTLAPLEVIVVDDGSTDGSRAVAERFGPPVRVVANPGRGASAARNHASQLAQGAFYQYLDADDLLEPHALASRVGALEAGGAEVAISDWRRLHDRGGQWVEGAVESGNLPALGGPLDLRVFEGFWAPPAAILYRRSICERIGGWRETLPVIQDARYLLDATRLSGAVVHVRGVGASYRQHAGGSLSTESAVRFWRDVLQNAREIEALWAAAYRIGPAHRRALADAYGLCARQGVALDEALYAAGRLERRRFVEEKTPRFLAAAEWLHRLGGYRLARAALAPFSRSSR